MAYSCCLSPIPSTGKTALPCCSPWYCSSPGLSSSGDFILILQGLARFRGPVNRCKQPRGPRPSLETMRIQFASLRREGAAYPKDSNPSILGDARGTRSSGLPPGGNQVSLGREDVAAT